MKLLVGLGNPGPKYEQTRHNVGFLVLDKLADKEGFSWGQGQFKADLAKGSALGQSLALLKPMTFMNLSGQSVAAACRFFKIDVTDVVVFHDDLDMDFGKVKLKRGGGHGGHNGIRSMMAELGSGDFSRIKVGIGRPEVGSVSSWVLSKLSEDELSEIDSSILVEVEGRLSSLLK